jgi:hypothetical protein
MRIITKMCPIYNRLISTTCVTYYPVDFIVDDSQIYHTRSNQTNIISYPVNQSKEIKR